jgi:metal-responsive CopG/Arc/MetJ family transcriptional regulator
MYRLYEKVVKLKCTGYDGVMNLNLSLPDELADEIEDFWHENRFGSRSEAIRWLIQAALDKKLKPGKPAAAKGE